MNTHFLLGFLFNNSPFRFLRFEIEVGDDVMEKLAAEVCVVLFGFLFSGLKLDLCGPF